MELDQTPPAMGAKIHEHIRDMTGADDPYRPIKDRSNAYALGLLPVLQEEVTSADDPFEMAVRFALAGNIIDFGAISSVDNARIDRTLRSARTVELSTTALASFKQAAERADSILYIGDNAGEIVFDRLLLEQLPAGKATYAVRGKPIINDATMVDAEEAGIHKAAAVIDTGSGAPGVVIEDCSSSFHDAFFSADLIIAKGQGNYETLSEAEADITFLLMAKCPVIARDIGCEVGSFIIRNRHGVPVKACGGGQPE
jgi:hypothetical protein